MGNSTAAFGLGLGDLFKPGICPARTPGTLGINDHGDPNAWSFLGDTPGSLGLWDFGDPAQTPLRPGFPSLGGAFARTQHFRAMSLVPNQCVAGIPVNFQSVVGAITSEQLAKIFPQAKADYLKQVADELNNDLPTYGLDSALRRAHFFAQVRQEAGSAMAATVENLNYSPESLIATFSYYANHKDEAATDGYEKDPKTKKITRAADQKAIANKAYGNRYGNGSVASEDGWNFRGRGLKQVTFRSNYKDISDQYAKLYPNAPADFIANPGLMAAFPHSVRSAVCFWIRNNLHKLADHGSTAKDVDAITAVVNKNTKSYKDRQDNFTIAYNAFK